MKFMNFLGEAQLSIVTVKWEKIFLKPDAQEIDVKHLDISLNDYGIIFNNGN